MTIEIPLWLMKKKNNASQKVRTIETNNITNLKKNFVMESNCS